MEPGTPSTTDLLQKDERNDVNGDNLCLELIILSEIDFRNGRCS